MHLDGHYPYRATLGDVDVLVIAPTMQIALELAEIHFGAAPGEMRSPDELIQLPMDGVVIDPELVDPKTQ
jgi:hypothetical protein